VARGLLSFGFTTDSIWISQAVWIRWTMAFA
jgi:hypothetical protein